MARRIKAESWAKGNNLKKIRAWAEEGLSIKEIAEKIGISRSTFYVWIDNNPDISDALTAARTCADIEVENSLYKKCTGFKETIKKTVIVDGEPVEIECEVFIPPDTTAQKFWLVNRRSKHWQGETKITLHQEEETGGVVMLPSVVEAKDGENEVV